MDKKFCKERSSSVVPYYSQVNQFFLDLYPKVQNNIQGV